MGLTRLGVIGGAGWLGAALIKAALADGVVAPEHLTVSSRSGATGGLEVWPAIRFTADNVALAADSDVVILSVRPQDLDGLSLDLSGKLVISVMAMVPMADLAARFGTRRIIRAMPNACAAERLSFTPWFASPQVDAADRAFAEAFFDASGETAEVAREPDLDYFTGLTGSGPAFLAAFADAMIEDAVASGIARPLAERAVRQLFLGGGQSVAKDPASPRDTVDRFLAYAGTTAAGLAAMEDAGLREAISAGLGAAWAKARQGL